VKRCLCKPGVIPAAIALAAFIQQAPALGAQTASYCTSLQQLSVLDYCFQNPVFVEHADKCLVRFDQDIVAGRNRLTSGFQKHDKASASAQLSKFENSGTDLTDTDRSLKALIATGQQARAELVAYINSLIYTGHPVLEFLQYNGLLAARQSDPCWRDNHQRMLERLAKLDKKIDELKRADIETSALNKISGSRQRGLDITPDTSSRAPASRTVGLGAGKLVPFGKSARSSSTITGKIHKENNIPTAKGSP